MTEQEALEILNNECEDVGNVQLALHIARKSLEKQIAKKPIVTVVENTNCRLVRCSCCNEKLVWMYPKPINYCRNCGTKLDWGNEDDRD